jgi:predicted permease
VEKKMPLPQIMRSFLRDFRFGVRMLGKNPGFTAIAVLVLSLGIGANTAVFSAVYAVLLKPLPYRDPATLIVALHDGRSPVSPADYLDYRAQASAVLTDLAAAQAWGGALSTGSESEVVPGLQITPNMLPLLGVQPAMGRVFSPEEAGSDVIILSDSLWRTRFASDTALIGKTIPIGGKPYRVAAIMPPGFQFAPFWQTEAQMWRPYDAAAKSDDRGGSSLRLFGRLRNGVSLRQAQTQMSTIAARLEAAYPASNTGLGITVVPLHEKVAGPIRPTLLILLGTVGFVLIIACADIANLLLARAVGRRKEMATRLALGATRFQLVRQLGIESLILAAIGGTAGILLARFGLEMLRTTLPAAGLPRQNEITLDGAVMFFASLVSLAAGLAFGLIPSLQASGVDVNQNLKESGRGASEGRGTRRTQNVLVVAQVSMALVLLVCAGLLVRSLQHLNAVDAGFNPRHLLTFEVAPPKTRFDTPEKREALFQRISNGLAAMPGVSSVSAINHIPIGGDTWTFPYQVGGRSAPPPGHEFGAVYRVVRPKYFRTMQIRMISGRDFTDHDDKNAPSVVIINEALARHQWPSENPVGRTLVLPDKVPLLLTVIGVVHNARQSDWTSPADDEFYFPYAQRLEAFGSTSETFVLRTTVAPEAVAAHLDRSALGIDPDVPVSAMRTMETVISEKLWRSRVSTLLLSVFASIALLLSAAGIYSVIAYSVRRRTQELGIRVALGASPGAVVWMVLRDSFGPVAAGVALGIMGAFAGVRLLGTLLYEVPATDPLTFTVVVVCLVATSVAASAIPAMRALRADPLSALRNAS